MEDLNIQVIVTGVVGLITTVTSSWFSWFLAKKKYNTEVDSALIANMQESLEFYKKLSDDNKSRLDEVLRRNDQLEKANDQLREDNAQLRQELTQVREQVFTLMNNICYNLQCSARQKVIRKPKGRKDNGTEVTQEIH